MSDTKLDVGELVNKDDFDSLLKVLFGKDEQLANRAARGIAEIIVEPRFVGSMGDKSDESHRRLEILLSKEYERVLDVMFALLQTRYAWQVEEVVMYIVRHGRWIDLFQRLDQEEYRTTQEHIFKVLLFIDKIVESDRLPVLFQGLEQGKYDVSERTAIFQSLISLTVLDRVWGAEYRAPSGLTGDTDVALAVLKRANNDDDVIDFLQCYSEPVGILSESVEDLLASKCHEKTILEVLEQCSSYHAISVLCRVLERIGTEESLSTLRRVPLDIRDRTSAFELTTETPIYLTVSAICERLEIPRLQRLSTGEPGIVKEIAVIKLDERCKPS